jgi:hypothetical protein
MRPLVAPIIPNARNILDSALKTKSNSLVESLFLEQWASEPNAGDALKALQYVVSCKSYYSLILRQGMAPMISWILLTPKPGNALADAGVKLTSPHGTTEVGDITCLWRDEVDLCNWVRFSPHCEIR